MSSSSSSSIDDPNDLSSLYFGKSQTDDDDASSLSFIGPIAIAAVKQNTTTGGERCLRATRDIAAGELLFVETALVSADVSTVLTEWNNRPTEDDKQKQLEEIAERVLVNACLKTTSPGILNALSCLQGSKANNSCFDDTVPTFKQLLGQDESSTIISTTSVPNNNDGDDFRQIIRRNAFGPDFITFDYIEKRRNFTPARLLGLYPVAAMINHSCVPNAVRVYVRSNDVMVVHACQTIPAGQEIVWSYIPVIQNYAVRKQLLQDTHGFVCTCPRCRAESKIWSIVHPIADRIANRSMSDNDDDDSTETLVNLLEHFLLENKSVLNNETQRYIRTGFLNLYMEYLNEAKNPVAMLDLVTQLHFALAASHNASTEHLSILHLCYELVGAMHIQQSQSTGGGSDQTPSNNAKLRFWTDQLKRAVMIRYGALGNDLNQVRRMMQHSRTVLRNQNGMDQVEHKFI